MTDFRKLLSIKRASELTGLERRKLRELIEQGQLAAFHGGGSKRVFYRVRPSDLEALIRKQEVA